MERLSALKQFGFLFSGLFFALSAYLLLSSIGYWVVSLVVALALLVVTIVRPDLLAPWLDGWLVLGHFLGKIVSPIVLGLIFFVLITPVALLGRIAGRDPLRIKPRAISSYWINREPAGPAPDSFKNQF
jgi:hypothetical protein